jgi:hypothetical protein
VAVPAEEEMELPESLFVDQLGSAFYEKVDALVVRGASRGHYYQSIFRNIETMMGVFRVGAI